jgi:uncharacterized membrane protein YraQ (UPF0718 family)
LIKAFADIVTYKLFAIEAGSLFGEALNFFIYDTVKIFLLLIVIIFAVSMIRSFLPPEKVRKILSRKRQYEGNVLAALLGMITPFCSCSAIPLFLGFLEAGVPIGVTFSFLIASPMINEVALVLLFGIFGIKIALIYIFSGLVIAVLAGIIIGRQNPEKLIRKLDDMKGKTKKLGSADWSWKERIVYAGAYTFRIFKKVWIFVILGVGLGAWIHGYVPTDFLAAYAGADKWYAVPVAVIIGVPLYANAAGIIPLVGALTEKGVAMGTVLAFMMAVTALSLPEFTILKRVMKTRLIVMFAGIVSLGILFTGYLFNFILV